MNQAIITLAAVLAAGLCLSGCGGDGSSRNQAPRLSTIADTTVSANETSAAITVTVQDRDANGLVLTATSSNPSVVADAGLALAGAGQDRTLTVTPLPATLGTTTITVTATDSAGLTAQTAFMVTVQPQQVSFSQFVKDAFAAPSSARARDINSRVFDADADDDAFTDLLN